MAKTHGSVRIGPISLLTLVIVLCLAVMAVLTVATAQASLNLTQRQANATSTLYGDELAGQRFVAATDAYLVAHGKDEGFSTQTIAEVLPTLCEETAQFAASQGCEVAVSAQWLNADALCASAGVTSDVLDRSIVGGILAECSGEAGRTLQIALAITSDADYRLLAWKKMTMWTEEGTGETLWLGNEA